MAGGAKEVHPGFRHPLMGARLSTLLRAFTRYGFVSPRHVPLALALVGFAALRAPIGWAEKEWSRRRPRRTAAPLFIVGHWRTGTTHLHNLLGQSPLFGHISPLAAGLPDELLTLATWLKPWLEKALPEARAVDRVRVEPDSPQEDEIPLASQQLLSVFHALYFPRRFRELFRQGVFFEGVTEDEIESWARHHAAFIEKVALHQKKDRILVKNPVYTARLARLERLWPGAQFIHIRRNPYTVYASTLHYYRRLLRELALQPYTHIDLERFVLESFVELMERYDREAGELPPDRLVEIAFEDLEARPLDVLETIHKELGLEAFPETKRRVGAYLERIAGYRKNELLLTSKQRQDVERHWGPYLARWGYGCPSDYRSVT